MSDSTNHRPRELRGPTGRLLRLEDLPHPDTERWVPRRKAEVVIAVRNGLLTVDEACSRYRLSQEEFAHWEALIDRHGVKGLRVTRARQLRRETSTVERRPGRH